MKRLTKPAIVLTFISLISMAMPTWSCSQGGQIAAGDLHDWSRFRGPLGQGISEQKGFASTWTADDYAWRIPLPGNGHSCPAIAEDRLFITSANDQGTTRNLHCLSVATGEQLWIKSIDLEESHIHLKNSWASSTPAVDDNQVYVAFADEERVLLTAYDFSGNQIWQRDLGPFESQHGLGSSPMIFGNMVVLANDQMGKSSIEAFSRANGETVWKTDRESGATSYATPVVIQLPDEDPQLLCASAASGLASLNPIDGKQNWKTDPFPARTVSSPVYGAGMVIQTCGGGGVGKYMIAVNPSLKLDDESKRIVYSRKKSLPYVPTPIIYGDHVYLWNDKGVAHCVDIQTGENVWTKRVGPAAVYSSSPVCIDGKIYCPNEKGEVLVIAASPKYHFFGSSTLDDSCHSTPVVGNGRLFFRTFHFLTCLTNN